MATICKKAGIEGNFSNHSGKRTCATSLYDAGIDEQEIMLFIGRLKSNRIVLPPDLHVYIATFKYF